LRRRVRPRRRPRPLHSPPRPQVDEAARVNAGGGICGHGEAIEVLALPFDAAADFVVDSSCPKSPGLMFGITWAAAGLRSGKLKGRAGTLETEPLELRSVLPS
jgi:UDP-sugar diphosphatase